MSAFPTHHDGALAISPAMLRNIPIFANLGEDEIAQLVAVAAIRSFPKNTVVIHEGDHSDSIYLINSGKVKVLISNSEGQELILTLLGPGEYFGELALIDSQPRSATVVSMTPVHFTVIAKPDFDRCLANNPGIASRIMIELAQRLRNADLKIEGLALMDVYGRVAHTLLQLAQSDNGEMLLNQKLSQQDIANMVGASREMVSRTLKDLALKGYIRLVGKNIVVNPARFQKEFL
ncbi:MAG: Crp/Fnr family transcriptional regulator [Sulfuricellaceae bacterium]